MISENIRVGLYPLVRGLNLPTVIKTAIPPGGLSERLYIATQTGEIYYLEDNIIGTFLDISRRIIRLGAFGGGYDERGLLGLAFHPDFYFNGLFYLHYSVAGSQGPGALAGRFIPDPCNIASLNMQWTNRDSNYDHIDTVEEWAVLSNGQAQRRRTLLNIRRPFFNHNGVNSLNFSPETGRLVFTNGDGGMGYDPFNLSQNDMEIAGKIIEIDVSADVYIENMPVVTRFDELPIAALEAMTVIAKGVRNISGISYQKYNGGYVKYVGNVGQDLVESVFSFAEYKPVPAAQIALAEITPEGFINLGWRGWEGDLPTQIIRACTADKSYNEKITAYYIDTIFISAKRLRPLTCYYHEDPRPGKFSGTALTGVQAYMGSEIPELTGSVVFTDFQRRDTPDGTPVRGALAFAKKTPGCRQSEYSIIDVDYDFGAGPAYYTCLGTGSDRTRLFLGVYGSNNVTERNLGTVYEIIAGNNS